MHWATKDKIRGGFLGALLLLAVVGAVSYLSTLRLIETGRSVAHTYRIREQMEALLADVIDAQTAMRGYLLTNQDRYLQPYHAAKHDLPARVAALRHLAGNNPRQQKDIDALEDLVGRRLVIIEAVLARQKGRSPRLLPSPLSRNLDEGKAVTDAIRQVVARMQAEETELLRRREQRAQLTAQRTLLVIVSGGILAILLSALAVILIDRDMALRKQAEDALRDREETLHGFYDSIGLMMGVVELLDDDILHISGNAETARYLGLDPEKIMGSRSRELGVPEERVAMWREHYCKSQALGRPVRFEYERESGDRGLAWMSATCCPIGRTAAAGERMRFAYVIQDMTDRKLFEAQIGEYSRALEAQKQELQEVNARLEVLATRDGLTGIMNHRAFKERLNEEVHYAARYGQPLSLLLIDVDHFKQYNDTFGHPAGDDVLKAVANVLEREARVSDMVARYGGEEFAMVLRHTAQEGAMIMAERLRAAIEAHPWIQRPVTVSVGVATQVPQMQSMADLIVGADQALYASKRAGRNRVTPAHAMASANTPDPAVPPSPTLCGSR